MRAFVSESDVIASVYSGLLCKDAIGDALDKIAGFLGADRATLMLVGDDNVASGYHTPSYDPDLWPLYNDHMYKLDPHLEFSKQVKVGEVQIGQEHVRNDDIRKTDYYNLIYDAHDMKDIMFGVFEQSSETRRSAISIQRRFRCDYFAHDDKRRLKLVLPHLRNAHQMARSLICEATRQLGSASTEDVVSLNVLPSLKVLDGADQFAQALGGLGWARIHHDRLVFADMQLHARIQSMAEKAAQTGQGDVCVYRTSDEAVFTLRVAPVPDALLDRLPILLERSVILQISRPAALPARPEVISAFSTAYELTAKEHEVLLALLRHKDLKLAAQACDIYYSTARSHLRQIFQKTQCRSQVELMARIACL